MASSGDHKDAKSAQTASALRRGIQWVRRVLPGWDNFEGQRYLRKWLPISLAIGIVAGLGAILFSFAIDFVTEVALGEIVGYLPPSPVGEGNTGLMAMERPWLLPIVTGLGGLVSGIIVYSLAPEAEGHGTDAAIDAIHHKRGRVRLLVVPVKLVSSAITIGTGGSAGREGPAAQISAGFGSFLGQRLGLSPQERRIAVAVGMGAGIGAIFRAPLGGALMAAEILYINDMEVEALTPTLIAAIIGYTIYGLVYGYEPIFGEQVQFGLTHPTQLLYYALLGVICGLVGLLYNKSFYGVTDVFHKLRTPRWIKPAIGGVLVGCMGLVIPGALHTGYGWVQISMGEGLFNIPLWMVLLLPFAKILSTSLSIGSGGSGGIFGPGMVIGGLLGASFWRLGYNVLPQMPTVPAPFVIIGMMALFGSIAHAPLAMMLMVAEMTGNLSLLAPAMVAVAIATALVGNSTIYRSQLGTRADSPTHRVLFSFPLLSSLLVRDAMKDGGPVIAADTLLSVAEERIDADKTTDLVVHNKRNEVIGFLSFSHLQQIPPSKRTSMLVQDVMVSNIPQIEPNEAMDVALERIASRGMSWGPVLESRQLIGRLHVSDVMQIYKSTLEQSVRRATALTSNSTLFEVRVHPASPLAGHMLKEVSFPANTLVVSINRDGETLFPRATTQLEAGDIVMVMADQTSEPELRTFLEGAPTTTS